MGQEPMDPVFEGLLAKCLQCMEKREPISDQLRAEILQTPISWEHVMRSQHVLGESTHTELIWNTFGLQGLSALSPVG